MNGKHEERERVNPEKVKSLLSRLSRYSEKCITDNFEQDFASAVCEAVETISTLQTNEMFIMLEVASLKEELADCRNELCYKCGEYKMRHKGACDGCRWKQY